MADDLPEELVGGAGAVQFGDMINERVPEVVAAGDAESQDQGNVSGSGGVPQMSQTPVAHGSPTVTNSPGVSIVGNQAIEGTSELGSPQFSNHSLDLLVQDQHLQVLKKSQKDSEHQMTFMRIHQRWICCMIQKVRLY